MVHYSDSPRIEFRLNDFKDRNSVLRALRGLRYVGGNTRTGKWHTPLCLSTLRPANPNPNTNLNLDIA